MHTAQISSQQQQQPAGKAGRSFTDIKGLQAAEFWPMGRAPSLRTLGTWTRTRKIPHHKVGAFVYYDIEEVERHIRTKMLVPARLT
jgi:hypothetical protein